VYLRVFLFRLWENKRGFSSVFGRISGVSHLFSSQNVSFSHLFSSQNVSFSHRFGQECEPQGGRNRGLGDPLLARVPDIVNHFYTFLHPFARFCSTLGIYRG